MSIYTHVYTHVCAHAPAHVCARGPHICLYTYQKVYAHAPAHVCARGPHTCLYACQKFEEIVAGPEATRYGPIVAGHEAAIEALFKKIDGDADGFLVTGELKDVVAKYTGEAFDEYER